MHRKTGISFHIRFGKFLMRRNPPASGSYLFIPEGGKIDWSNLSPQPCSISKGDTHMDRKAVMLLVPARSQGSWDYF